MDPRFEELSLGVLRVMPPPRLQIKAFFTQMA